MKRTVLLIIAILLLNGCYLQPRDNGYNPALTEGTLLGPYINFRTNEQLDFISQSAATQAMMTAMASGQPRSWQTLTSTGIVVPNRAYPSNNTICRSFSATVNFLPEEKRHVVKGTACKNSVGDWLIRG